MPVRIRQLLDRCEDCADSGSESIFAFRLNSLGVAFERQVEIPGIGRVDFLIGKRLMFSWDEVLETLLAVIRRRDHLKALAEPPELARVAAETGGDHALGYWDDPDFVGC